MRLVVRDSDGDVLFATQEFSRELPAPSVRVTVAVGGMFANRYIFISQLLAQRVGPRVYIRRYVTHRAAETPTFRANKTSYPRAHYGSIFRLYCPLHLIWRPRSPLMDPRISRFSSAKGCANRSVICRIFLDFLIFLAKLCCKITKSTKSL